MIILSVALLGFAVTDLLRWSPERVSTLRALLSVAGGVAVAIAVAILSDLPGCAVLLLGGVILAVVGAWALFDEPWLARCGPGCPLLLIAAALVAAFATSSLANPIGGPLETWYLELGFPFVDFVSVDQFVLGLSAVLFLLATANRVVRLVLTAAGTSMTTGETALRGGRLLGPMERLVVAATVLSGDPTGAALVIAAKGLLRLPEIRHSTDQAEAKDDQVTEYFLIGTFSSLLLAALLGTLILASG